MKPEVEDTSITGTKVLNNRRLYTHRGFREIIFNGKIVDGKPRCDNTRYN
jgi:hypothetical protein